MTLTLHEAARKNGRVIYLELTVLVLSLYSLGALTAELLLTLDPETRALLGRVDDFVCAVFLLDFGVHWALAPSKRAFWRLGWIDLLSSIPEIGWLRWGRVFRVFRIMRALRSFQAVYDHLAAERAKGTFAMVGLMSVVAVLSATIAVFEFERAAPGSNIHSAGDALWWAFATITTIGYGDHYPVTVAGRIVAVVLVVFGLSFFGTFTAYVASFFLEKTQLKEESEIHRLIHEVRQLREQVARLETAVSPPSAASPATPSATGPSRGETPG
ncbi:MAG: potassium channel family protein [Verrucomicrobia bacterium]|nr:potassium channel family protein [Verrucomicrobiota bacterium]